MSCSARLRDTVTMRKALVGFPVNWSPIIGPFPDVTGHAGVPGDIARRGVVAPEDRVAANVPARPVGQDGLGPYLPRLGRGEIRHGPEHLAQRRRDSGSR